MKQPGPRICPAILFLVILFACMATAAFAAELQEIRTGKKSGFTRIVFEFNGPVRYLVKESQGAGKLLLTFTESTSGPGAGKKIALAPPIKSITVQAKGKNLKTGIDLATPQYRMQAFTLTEPDRVVFDLYPLAPAASEVRLNRMVVKASMRGDGGAEKTEIESPAETAEKSPNTAAPEQAASPPPAAEAPGGKPGIQKPRRTAEVPSRQPAPQMAAGPEIAPAAVAPAQPAGKQAPKAPETAPAAPKPSPASGTMKQEVQTTPSGNFQTYLIAALAVISIVIFALIGMLLLQRKNTAGRTRRIDSGEELKTTADIMASIDAKIREKFKQYEESNPKGAD
ncbi:MAG: hypothetical protein LJE94_03190 [Deltaproteobacteria bacterium]|nr:hypothetical protein [Deltaproteobacteria bacterium]